MAARGAGASSEIGAPTNRAGIVSTMPTAEARRQALVRLHSARMVCLLGVLGEPAGGPGGVEEFALRELDAIDCAIALLRPDEHG